MSLPRQLFLKLANNKLLNFIQKEKSTKKLSGVSEKAIYYNVDDVNHTRYFVKKPKVRLLETIMEDAPALFKARQKMIHLNGQKHKSSKLYKIKIKVKRQIEQLEKQYKEHCDKLRDSQFFLEVLSPRIAEAIFENFLVVPENYFFRIGDDKYPLILSKGIKGFDEFLSKKTVFHNKTAVKDWDNLKLPSRKELNLTVEEAEVLGKLLFVALLMGHLDLFNNINSTNSGKVLKNGKLLPAIVDWGNTLGTGLGGFREDDNAFKNPDLLRGKIDFNSNELTGFQHCVPFDNIVYPILPRQIVKDLFNLSGDDEISQAMFRGFEEANKVAQSKLYDIDTLVPATIETVLLNYTGLDDINYIHQLLDEKFYRDTTEKSDNYTLTNVLKGRLRSLQSILDQLKTGYTLEQIAQSRLTEIMRMQNYIKPPITKKIIDIHTSFFAHHRVKGKMHSENHLQSFPINANDKEINKIKATF